MCNPVSNLLSVQELSLLQILFDPLFLRKTLGHILSFSAPLGPSNEIGELGLVDEVESAREIVGIKPTEQRNKGHIHKAKAVSTKIRLVSQLFFQHFKTLNQFFLCSFFLFFSFLCPNPHGNFIYLFQSGS